ncbi:MAG: DUF742 domain-containing protein [Ilumatobacter sp.]|uniref:DUF742 domain-containing protein n=1 Tax=Ilumatobacter sp. TaxID=1967498 RepID=UPI0032976CD9
MTVQSGRGTGDVDAAGGPDADEELVRGFMLTRGRTRATVQELPIETVVSATMPLDSRHVACRREYQRVRDLLVGPMSIAEVSAHLMIPLRAAVVISSEMVAAGLLTAGTTVDSSDIDLLYKIRTALQLL